MSNQYFNNSKLIINRERAKNWNENKKTFYTRQTANRVIISKRMKKLRESKLWKKTNKTNKYNLKKILRDKIEKNKKKKSLHDNAFE